LPLRIWYCSLSDPELHIPRVRARMSRGGHDIPTTKFHERFDASRNNLCSILPSLGELLLYDNGIEADPSSGQPWQPVQLLHFRDGKILCRVSSMPNWAKPIAAVVMSLAK
jgi:predicted ABC-type ATPase